MQNLVHDLRYALRRLLRSPGYAATVVATLALGIGGVTAMFSLVDGILLKPLPYRKPDRLVLLFESIPEFRERYPMLPVNSFHFRRWKEAAGSFESLSLFTWDEETLTDPGEPRRASVARVDSAFFTTLGARPRIGRDFVEEETVPGGGNVVILTDGFWRRELESDPDVLGQMLSLNGRQYEVIGVLPSTFKFFDPARIRGPFGANVAGIELVRPFEIPQEVEAPTGEFNYAAVARLKANVQPIDAKTELDVLQASLAAEVEMPYKLESIVKPLGSTLVSESRDGLWLGFGAVAMVLLIGCVNIAHLALARAVRLESEFATRAALGAGRGVLLRQSLMESGVLTSAGGALGVWLAYVTIAWFRASTVVDLPRLDEVQVDLRVVALCVAATALSAILVGALPAFRASGARPLAALSNAARGSVGSRGARRIGDWLAGGEVALSVSLLIVAGLLLHSLTTLLGQDLGFSARRTATARLSLPPAKYTDRQTRLASLRSILSRIRSLPGVESAGLVTLLPLSSEDNVNPILAAEAEVIPPLQRPMANYRWASPDYFGSMGIEVLEGRVYLEEEPIENAIVISRSTAERLWPDESAIGRRIRQWDEASPHLEVVGVVADTPVASLERSASMVVYQHYATRPRNTMQIAVRANAGPDALTPAVRQAIWQVEPESPAVELVPAALLVSDAASERSFQASLLVIFSSVALALACLGVYSVLAQTVNGRTKEMGLRMALGARASDIRRTVLGEGLRPVAWGLVIGCAVAAAGSRLLRSMLFEVDPLDPLAFATAPAILLAAAFGSCLLPARRAASVDPMTALRHD